MIMEFPIKRLEGWLTFPEAAEMLGMSKQGFHKLAFEGHTFGREDIRKVGSKPTYLARRDSVIFVKNLREEAAEAQREMENLLTIVVDERTEG